jgi:hypothetical protein
MDAETEIFVEEETEIFVEEEAEIIARKALEGFQQATQRCDGDWAGKTFDAYELVAMVDGLDDYATPELCEKITNAACNILDDWGGPWVIIPEREE